jgi:hypothetical protein
MNKGVLLLDIKIQIYRNVFKVMTFINSLISKEGQLSIGAIKDKTGTPYLFPFQPILCSLKIAQFLLYHLG